MSSTDKNEARGVGKFLGKDKPIRRDDCSVDMRKIGLRAAEDTT